MTTNTVNLNFHSWDANTTLAVNYDSRIECINGGGVGNGVTNFYALQFRFYAPIFMNVDGTILQVISMSDM